MHKISDLKKEHEKLLNKVLKLYNSFPTELDKSAGRFQIADIFVDVMAMAGSKTSDYDYMVFITKALLDENFSYLKVDESITDYKQHLMVRNVVMMQAIIYLEGFYESLAAEVN